MNIIIPLGGKGERFKNEGFLNPKPLIKILNKEMILYVLENINVNEEDNIFIFYNNSLDEYDF
jgi:NDP-sugar pyrophosphorylase family protein